MSLLKTTTRRAWLSQTALGFGSLALGGLSTQKMLAGPLTAAATHFAPRAKRVIFLFTQGGQSQMDLFDPKPTLARLHGKSRDGKPTDSRPLKASPFRFVQHGESGLELSSLWQHLPRHADDICLVRSVETESPNHSNAMLAFHTGSANLVRPSVGSWVAYGLGTDSQSLPGFITIRPTIGHGSRVYSNAFLPAIYQGVALGNDSTPTRNIGFPNLSNSTYSREQQRELLAYTQSLNRGLAGRVQSTAEMEGLIQSYERAFRMQIEATELFDLAHEPQHVLDLYGIGEGPTDEAGRMCLLARRFAEAGVRYIQVNHGGWDHHSNIDQSIANSCRAVDQPFAGLITDLKQRGMLDETLIVSCGEFGRTAEAEGELTTGGRNHNHHAMSLWMAGGGSRGGVTYGRTDEFGARIVEGRVDVHDVHATILHLLGLDHERLTYEYHGRQFRLTDVYGNVIEDVVT